MFRQSIACLLLAMLNVSLAQNYPPGVPVPRTQGKQMHFFIIIIAQSLQTRMCVLSQKIEQFFFYNCF